MAGVIRRFGIAIGSLVIAYLAVSLVARILLGEPAASSPLVGVFIVLLGGLVFVDIVRRERPTSAGDRPRRS